MGIDVALMEVAQSGTSTKRRRLKQLAAVLDSDDCFAQICQQSAMPMLRRADPYGDLILTPSEMDQFINELTAVAIESGGASADRVAQVLDLAYRCKDNARTELHLQGD